MCPWLGKTSQETVRLWSRQSGEENRHTNLLPVQSNMQTIGMMGIRQDRIYPSLLGSVGVPAGLNIGVGFFLVLLVTAYLLGDR